MEHFAKAYEILGLKSNATHDEVKRAYRRLAFRYHPDINPSAQAQEAFLNIQKAYEIITTAEKTWANAEPIKKSNPIKQSRDRDRVRIPREEAIKQAREKARRYEQIKLQREARVFAKFKRSVYYPWTIAMSYVSVLMFTLIFIDAFLVTDVYSGFVKQKAPIVSNLFGFETTTGYQITFGDGQVIEVDAGPGSQISKQSHVSFAQSMIFRDIPQVHVVNESFKEFSMNTFNKPPYLFFLIFIAVPMLVLYVDKPSAVFYSAGAFARYGVLIFILTYILF